MTKPRLKFGPDVRLSGFTAWNTASFNDLQPARIVRELIQNSLDAAADAGEPTAFVRFRATIIDTDSVPDFAGYKKAFKEAVRDNRKSAGGTLSDAAQHVVDTIQGAIDSLEEGNHYLLAVEDNGIGLNKTRMTALLGDGSNAKSTSAAGSYGVGHFSAVPASDLRYLLYGGVLSNGRRIAAGTAVVAGRYGKRHPFSAQGYLVKKLLGGSDGAIYDFLNKEAIPAVIDDALKQIRKEWGHGSVVMIPGFNYFGGHYDHWLRDIVRVVAGYNFSAAIHEERLVVEVDEVAFERGEKTILDKTNLANLLEGESDRQRAFRRNTMFEGLRPSGRNAWAAYKTLATGEQASVATPLGVIKASLLVPAPAGTTRLDLFRNGMWITEDVPGLNRADFADWQPFHAVLQPRQGDEVHRLVRKAEGPMHNQLAFNLLSDTEREQLETALRAVGAWIKSNVSEIDTAEYTPDDFLVVAAGGEGVGSGKREFSMWGSPVVVQRPRMSQQEPTPRGTRTEVESDRNRQRRTGNAQRNRQGQTTRSRPLPFISTVVPEAPDRHRIALECNEAVEEVLIRLRIDENSDATCDRVWQDEEVTIRSFHAEDENGQVLRGRLQDGGTTIRLSGLAAKTNYRMTLEHEGPAGLLDAVRAPVLRIDLHKLQGTELDSEDGD